MKTLSLILHIICLMLCMYYFLDGNTHKMVYTGILSIIFQLHNIGKE